jgi:hypothetical protein
MRPFPWIATLLAGALVLAACSQSVPEVSSSGADAELAAVEAAAAGVGADLARVRAATARYHRVEVAEAAEYVNVNVGECVAHPELGAMGYHFVNFGLVDLELDPLQPEILVYAPGPNGQLRLGAVEYAVPIAPWDAIHGTDNPPMVLGQHLHAAPHLGLYVLHAWIWRTNPAGIFEDWNPRVSCD